MNTDNISIILKNTLYSGNIGAAARSMANFGLKNMVLVNPRCEFTEEAYARARYASTIFENAPVYRNLDELAPHFQLLIGTSRRGAYRLHMRMNPRLAVNEFFTKYPHVKIGVLFGDEKAGLSNDDLEKCAWYITIPTHPDFESLNLAHSVTVIAYEIYLAARDSSHDLYKFPSRGEDVEQLFKHIAQFLDKVGFPNRGSSERVHADIKRALSSADLKETDINLFHGFMRFMEHKYLGGWLPDIPRENNEEKTEIENEEK